MHLSGVSVSPHLKKKKKGDTGSICRVSHGTAHDKAGGSFDSSGGTHTRVAMATYYLSSQSRGGESRLGATAVTGQPEDAFLISAASVLGY